jgi:hypothetical protein
MHNFWYGKLDCRAYFLATAASSRSVLHHNVVSTYGNYHLVYQLFEVRYRW